MKRIVLAAAASSAALAAAGTPAQAHRHAGLSQKYQHEYWSCVRHFGGREPCGRNIVTRGVKYKGSPARPATKHEKAKSVRQLRRLQHPWVAPVPPVQAPARVSSVGGNPMVDPSCESSGNPQVWDPTHTYWGKYQFDSSTWSAYAPPGAPYGSATEQQQDQAAANVPYDAWPNC